MDKDYDDEENDIFSEYSEEFSYRLLQKSMITSLDENTIRNYANYNPSENEYHDEFVSFSTNMRNLLKSNSQRIKTLYKIN